MKGLRLTERGLWLADILAALSTVAGVVSFAYIIGTVWS